MRRKQRSPQAQAAINALGPLPAIGCVFAVLFICLRVFDQETAIGLIATVVVPGVSGFFIIRACFRFACRDIDSSALRHTAVQGVRTDIYSELELSFQALNPAALSDELRTANKETIDLYFKESRPTYQPYRMFPVDPDTWTLDKYERDLATINRAAMLLDTFGAPTAHHNGLRQMVVNRATQVLESLEERQDHDATLTEEVRQAILRQQGNQN